MQESNPRLLYFLHWQEGFIVFWGFFLVVVFLFFVVFLPLAPPGKPIL